MVKQNSVCITTTKETSKTRSLTLPPRNEYASCVNLLFKITVEARLTQSIPVYCYWQSALCADEACTVENCTFDSITCARPPWS